MRTIRTTSVLAGLAAFAVVSTVAGATPASAATYAVQPTVTKSWSATSPTATLQFSTRNLLHEQMFTVCDLAKTDCKTKVVAPNKVVKLTTKYRYSTVVQVELNTRIVMVSKLDAKTGAWKTIS